MSRALKSTPVAGVKPPARRGLAWKIPRAALVDVLAALLRRRDLRERAPQGLRSRPLEVYRNTTVDRMLVNDDLAPLVPRKLAREAGLRWVAAARARQLAEEQREQELRRRAEEAAARARAARERELAQERRWAERFAREKRERALRLAYSYARRLAYLDYAADCARRGVEGPVGPGWPERHRRFVEDCPGERPPGWEPPAAMMEVALASDGCIPYEWADPERWRRWVPKYVPGRPWACLEWGREGARLPDRSREGGFEK